MPAALDRRVSTTGYLPPGTACASYKGQVLRGRKKRIGLESPKPEGCQGRVAASPVLETGYNPVDEPVGEKNVHLDGKGLGSVGASSRGRLQAVDGGRVVEEGQRLGLWERDQG